MKLIDLTGQRFGRLIVKELSLNNKYKSFGAHWICQCDCGNTTTVFSSDLLSGKRNHADVTEMNKFLYEELQKLILEIVLIN